MTTPPLANPFTPTLQLSRQAPLPADLTPFISPSRGIRIRLDGHTCLVLPAVGLSAIDIVDGPSLQMLDLTQLGPGRINVSVTGCPDLQDVRFASEAFGHLFYHAEGELPEMTISGGIGYLDMGWRHDTRSFRVSADTDTNGPWRAAQLRYSPSRFSQSQDAESTFWALIYSESAGVVPSGEKRTLSLPSDVDQHTQPTDLYLVGWPDVDTFQWAGRPLRSLALHQLTALREVVLQAPADLLHINGAAQLASVLCANGVGRIKLDHSGLAAERLVVEAAYQSLQLTNSAKALEVRSDSTAPIVLEWCEDLSSVSLPPGAAVRCQGCAPDGLALNVVNYYVNEGVIGVLLSQIAQGDRAALAWEKLKRLLLYCARGPKLKAALTALANLKQLGVSEAEIWEARLRLNLKNRHPHMQLGDVLTAAQRQKALQAYEWTMPNDLYRECWEEEWNTLEATFPIWSGTPYAQVIYRSVAENEGALLKLRPRVHLRPRMTETSKRIALSVLEVFQNHPVNTHPSNKAVPGITLMAATLLNTLRYLPIKDPSAEEAVKASLFNTLDGKDLEDFLVQELAIDPVKTRLVIMKRLKALEKTRSYSNHVKRLKQLLLGGSLA